GGGLANARVGGRLRAVVLGLRGPPSPPASVPSGAVKAEQGIACPADERVHFDSADPDRLLARNHRHDALLFTRSTRSPSPAESPDLLATGALAGSSDEGPWPSAG